MIKKKSIQRMLIMRIALVAIVVSIVVSAVVIQKEHNREIKVAHDRAFIRAGTLKVLIQDQLDAPGLGDHAEIQKMLDTIAYKGFNLSFGHYVFGRVLDSALIEVARVEDRNYKELSSLERHVESEQIRPSGKKESPDFTVERIEGREYVHALVPLSNSKEETIAYLEGFFTTVFSRI